MSATSSSVSSTVLSATRYIDPAKDLQLSDLQGVFRGRSIRVKEEGFSNDRDVVFSKTAEGEASDGDLDPNASQGAKDMEDSRSQQKRETQKLGAMLPDLGGNPELLEGFIGLLRRSQRERDYRGLKESAEKFFPDPSNRHAALTMVTSVLKEEGGDAELGHQIQEIINELLTKHEAEIKAGYNISASAAEISGAKGEAVADLRDFYRQAVFGYQTPFRTYEFIMDQAPSDLPAPQARADESKDDLKIRGAVAFLTHCLSKDLESGDPSREPSYLKAVNDGIRNVGVLGQSHATCRMLLSKFNHETGGEVPVEPTRLMKATLGKAEGEQSSPQDFARIAEEFRLPHDALRINFMTQLQSMMRGLPERVFPTNNHRLQALESLQLCIDTLVEEEFQSTAHA